MSTTDSGLVYPDSSSDVQLWTHFQNLAESIEPFIQKPLCVLYRSSDQVNIPGDGTDTAILWNAERVDTDTFHSNTVNPSRIIPNKAGWYEINTTIVWQQNSNPEANAHTVKIAKNGTKLIPVGRTSPNDTDETTTCSTNTYIDCDGVSDYLEVYASQSTGYNKSAAGTSSDTYATYVSVAYYRPL